MTAASCIRVREIVDFYWVGRRNGSDAAPTAGLRPGCKTGTRLSRMKPLANALSGRPLRMPMWETRQFRLMQSPAPTARWTWRDRTSIDGN